jgi:predicted nuclease with TOPRIM domain
MELANMIGDICNILNFEMKSLAIKDNQIAEVRQTYEDLKEESLNAMRDIEETRRKELMDLQGSFDKKHNRFKEYQVDMERLNSDLQLELESTRTQCTDLDKAL